MVIAMINGLGANSRTISRSSTTDTRRFFTLPPPSQRPRNFNTSSSPILGAHEIRRYVKKWCVCLCRGLRPSEIPGMELPAIGFPWLAIRCYGTKTGQVLCGRAVIWNRGTWRQETWSIVSLQKPAVIPTPSRTRSPSIGVEPRRLACTRNSVGALANKHGKAWAISGPIYYGGVP